MQYDIPTLKVTDHMDETQVLFTKQSQGTPLQKVIDLITSNKETYLTADDLVLHESHLENWFVEDNIDRAVTFLMSILGLTSAVALVLFLIYYCRRQREIGVFFATLFAKLGVSQAWSFENCSTSLSSCVLRLWRVQ